MKVTVYHASPVKINLFEVTEQGIHFGSLESAVEAICRKIDYGENFFLHKVRLDISNYIENFDVGYNWRSWFQNEPDEVKGYIYTNKYEPSTEKSYVTWCPETIRTVLITQETLR
jgi:hypothetical protein